MIGRRTRPKNLIIGPQKYAKHLDLVRNSGAGCTNPNTSTQIKRRERPDMENRSMSAARERLSSALLIRASDFANVLACCFTSRAALVAYRNFDEASGTNVFDTAGNSVTNNGFFAPGVETPARVPG